MAIKNVVSAMHPAVATARRARSTSLPPLSTKPRKAALLIGCSYKGNKDHEDLTNPHQDAVQLEDVLMNLYHYEKANVKVLIDDGEHDPPTKANIEREMRKLVEGAKAGDSFFFHFSGHGVQTPCHPDDKTEPDGMDEAIVPLDGTDDKETWIIDNDMNKLLVRKIPVGAQLIAFFDMCHSGTALDLKHYCYNEGSTVYCFKRTSHDKVESKSRRLSELPSQEEQTNSGQGNNNVTANRENKKVRRFSYATRRNTMLCELSEASGASGLTESVQNGEHAAMSTAGRTKAHRTSSCAECGGLIEGVPEVSDEPSNLGQEQQGYMPARPVPQRKMGFTHDDIHIHAEQEEHRLLAAAPVRRYSIASPLERKYGCLQPLHLEWLRHFVKRRLSKLRDVSGEKANNDSAHGPPSRVSTTTSLTPLVQSPPFTSASVPTPSSSIIAPKPSNNVFVRRETPIVVASVLDAISEDPTAGTSSESWFFDNDDGAPQRCMSPLPDSSPASPTHAQFSENATNAPTNRRMAQSRESGRFQKRCKCMTASGWQPHGQVISIGAAADNQLAWDTDKGSLTSALVEILKKDAHPTFKQLLGSIQTVLDDGSNRMREYLKRMKLQGKAQGLSKQKRASSSRSASMSASTSRRNSHKSGDDIGDDIIDTMDLAFNNAGEGPVQRVVLGTEIRFDPGKVVFGL